MKSIKPIFMVVALFVFLNPNSLKSQTNWIKYEENPVIGDDFDPEALFIHRPCVLFDGDSYHMWYTGVRVFPLPQGHLQLSTMGYATSPDGISWQSINPVAMGPVLNLSTFDAMHAGQGWVIADNDTFKMWYWGFNPSVGVKGLNSIGYAWSLDGSNWTRVQGPGTLGSVYDANLAGLPDSLGLAMPCVVKTENIYHLWYTQVIDPPSIFRIGYATSSDGIYWTKVNGTGLHGSVIDWGSQGRFDELSAFWPAVIETDEGFMMWYQGYDGSSSRIGCSISSDGVYWDPAPGVGGSGACFEDALEACVIKGDTQYKMWYMPDDSANIVFLAFSDYNTGVRGSENPVRPITFTLEQNFPNPFNPSTRIEYIVKEPCQVNLVVYNLTGQIIKEFFNSYKPPGIYSITLNMQEIPSGIYFYRIQMGNFQAVKKMIKIE